MPIVVPDGDVPAFQKVMKAAIKQGHLPDTAKDWSGLNAAVTTTGAPAAGTPATGTPVPQASSEPTKKKGSKKAKAEPEPPAPPKPLPPAKVSKTPGGWASWKSSQPSTAGAPEPEAPAPKADVGGEDEPSNPWMQAADAVGGDDMFDPRSQGLNPQWDDMGNMPAPQSANVDLKKGKKPGMLSKIFGQKPKDPENPAVMQPKQSALSKIFKGKGPKVKQSDTDDDPTIPSVKAGEKQPEPWGDTDSTYADQAASRAAYSKGWDRFATPDPGEDPDADKTWNQPIWNRSPASPDDDDDAFGGLQKTLGMTQGRQDSADILNNLNWDLNKQGKAAGPKQPAPVTKQDPGWKSAKAKSQTPLASFAPPVARNSSDQSGPKKQWLAPTPPAGSGRSIQSNPTQAPAAEVPSEPKARPKTKSRPKAKAPERGKKK